MANVSKTVKSMAAGSLGAVLVGAFVVAANLTGTAAVIAGLFTFILVGSIAMAAMDGF